jgi:succinylglutamate desuccinylase
MIPCLSLVLCILAFCTGVRVVVSGATHGNELAGAWVVQRLEHRRNELTSRYPSLWIEPLLANPLAHEKNVRFIDEDLNRQFSHASLARQIDGDSTYEERRAKEIDVAVGGASATQADVLIDLHTTTTNMGCTLIVGTYSHAALAAAAYIAQQWTQPTFGDYRDTEQLQLAAAFPLRVLIDPEYSQEECPYMCSIARSGGLEVEVGPTPQGLLRADVVAATERAVDLICEYFDKADRGEAPPTPATLAAYVYEGKLAWPHTADETLPLAIIHPQLQGRDFEPLSVGDPLWLSVDGTVTLYEGEYGEKVVPIFVNEAAYYNAKSGRGIGLCRAVEWPLRGGGSEDTVYLTPTRLAGKSGSPRSLGAKT